MKNFLVKAIIIGAICGLAAKWLKDHPDITELVRDIWYGEDDWDEDWEDDYNRDDDELPIDLEDNDDK